MKMITWWWIALVACFWGCLNAQTALWLLEAEDPATPEGVHFHHLLNTGEGAQARIYAPEDWNGKLLLYNHGHIPESRPLSDHIPVSKEPYRSMLEDGWMLAASSYRRNGLVIADAVEDLAQLHGLIEEKFGKPETTLLLGISMGGAISLKLAEEQPFPVAGALILGRGLELREPGEPLPFSHQLTIPVLLMTNASEAKAPQAYHEAASGAGVPPELWIIEREGHISFSVPEYEAALEALTDWVEQAVRPGERSFVLEATPDPPFPIAISEDGTELRVKVSDVSPTYGNFEVSLTAEQLEGFGIKPGDRFQLKRQLADPFNELPSGGIPVLWGNTYADVPRGDWIAFINEYGLLQLAINYADAATSLGVRPGVELVLRRIE